MSSMKEGRYKPRLYAAVNLAAILRDFVVVRTHPRAMPLAMITTRKSTYGFPLLFYMGMGLRAELRYNIGRQS